MICPKTYHMMTPGAPVVYCSCAFHRTGCRQVLTASYSSHTRTQPRAVKMFPHPPCAPLVPARWNAWEAVGPHRMRSWEASTVLQIVTASCAVPPATAPHSHRRREQKQGLRDWKPMERTTILIEFASQAQRKWIGKRRSIPWMNAPDPDDSDEGEGSQRLSSTMSSRVHDGSALAAASKWKSAAASAGCCRRGRGRHGCLSIFDSRTQPPSSPAATSTRAIADRVCGRIRKEGGDVPAAAASASQCNTVAYCPRREDSVSARAVVSQLGWSRLT
jgi:hypothetical protein